MRVARPALNGPWEGTLIQDTRHVEIAVAKLLGRLVCVPRATTNERILERVCSERRGHVQDHAPLELARWQRVVAGICSVAHACSWQGVNHIQLEFGRWNVSSFYGAAQTFNHVFVLKTPSQALHEC